MKRRRHLALACAVAALLVGDVATVGVRSSRHSESVLARAGPRNGPETTAATDTVAAGQGAATTSSTGPGGSTPPASPPTTSGSKRQLPPVPLPPGPTGGLWPVWGPAANPASRPILFTRETVLYAVNPDGGGLRSLATYAVHPSWSPEGTQILFRGPASSQCEATRLFVMNADGTGQHRLTSTPSSPVCPDEYVPSWSPDGSRIAYMENSQGYKDPVGLYVMNADGSGRRHLCSCGSTLGPWDDGPSWSPDGTRLLFTGWEGKAVLYMIGADGSGLTRIADHARSGHWSRDGNEIVFTSGGDNGDSAGLSVIDRAGTVRRLTIPRPYTPTGATPPWSQVDAFPQWSPDGNSIVFSSNRAHLDDASGHFELFIINRDGTGLRKLTSKPCCASRTIDWPGW